jgi:hypothetical protein
MTLSQEIDSPRKTAEKSRPGDLEAIRKLILP